MAIGSNLISTIALLATLLITSIGHAETLTVTSEFPHNPGGLLTILEKAKSGDTIVFEPQLRFYRLELYDSLSIDKAITIDADALEHGLEITQLYSSPTSLFINTQADDLPFQFRNVIFDNIRGDDPAPIILGKGDFICNRCFFFHNTASSGSTGKAGVIHSQGGDVAFINSHFFSNYLETYTNIATGTIYSGSGSVAMVNSVAVANGNFGLSSNTALFHGTGNNQHFLIRNSTLVANFNTAFKLDTSATSTSTLSLGHNIIAGASDVDITDIDASFYSVGYNLLGSLSPIIQSKIQPSDNININLLDIFEERMGHATDNQINSGDVFTRPELSRNAFVIALREDGLAHNQGDPNFKASNIFFESAGFSDAIRLQLFQALQNGDQFGDIHPRIADSRIDIGAYEQESDFTH